MIELIKLQWLESRRKIFNAKYFFGNILKGLLVLYISINVLSLGYFADLLMAKFWPGVEPVYAFTRILWYYFVADILFRFMFQSIPSQAIKPYLLLPIPKSRLVNFVLLKSVLSLFNVVPLLALLPFYYKDVIYAESPVFAISWLVTLLSFILFNNVINLNLKRLLPVKPLVVVALLVLAGWMLFMDTKGWMDFSELFAQAVFYIGNNPWLAAIVLLITALAYWGTFRTIRSLLSEDSPASSSGESGKSFKIFTYLSGGGVYANLFLLQLKLVLRNTRPRTMMILAVLFLLYGFIFYSGEKQMDFIPFLIFIGIMLTGFMEMQYGQMVFAWDGSYFGFIRTKNLTTLTYIKGIYFFMVMLQVINFILLIPYAYFDVKILVINLAASLYNIGINSIFMLFFGVYNTERIALSESPFMNYQGIGAMQFVMTLVVFLLPVLFIFPLYWFDNLYIYVLFFGLIGIIGIVFREKLLTYIARKFDARKYIITTGFRKK